MLKRKMSETLMKWKEARRKRKVLLLLGARQTGKTFTVRRFAREQYRSFIEVNFLDSEERRRVSCRCAECRRDGSSPTVSCCRSRHRARDARVLRRGAGGGARGGGALSKFLVDDGRFDLILSGSLLGTALSGVASFPVGYARIERMYPP